jgi:hypothetical protein
MLQDYGYYRQWGMRGKAEGICKITVGFYSVGEDGAQWVTWHSQSVAISRK